MSQEKRGLSSIDKETRQEVAKKVENHQKVIKQ
jgi:hypothetical protein